MGYETILKETNSGWIAEKWNAAILQNPPGTITKKRNVAEDAKKLHDALLKRYSNPALLSELFEEKITEVFMETMFCELDCFETESRLTPDIFAQNTSHFIVGEVKINKLDRWTAINQIEEYSKTLSILNTPHKCAIFYGDVAEIINTPHSLYSKPLVRKY